MEGSKLARDPVKIDDVLKHYGVKGMKWGVRRANPSGGTNSGSEDAKTNRAIKAKVKAGGGTKALSNKELKDYLERMDLEKRYNKANPTLAKKAGKVVGDLLLQIGKEEVKKFAIAQVKSALTNR